MNYNFIGTNTVFPTIKYNDRINYYFEFISDNQLKNKRLWKLLAKQFSGCKDTHDKGWRGEFWGKLMISACLIYQYTFEEELYKILTDTVIDLLSKQDKKGRISTYKVKDEFSGWDMWCRKYVILGLQYYYEICKDESLKKQILTALVAHTDYIIKHIGLRKKPISKTSELWGSLNSYSILQGIVKLYKTTKKQKYLDFAKYIIDDFNVEGINLFSLVNNKEYSLVEYPVRKAYEMISCFEGLLEFYEITGNDKYLTTCENFANLILSKEFTVLGGSGCTSEYFDNSVYRQTFFDPTIEMQETCVTVSIMKYFTKLYLHTKNVKYIDAYEKTFYNVYLGAFNEKFKKNKKPIFFSYSPVVASPRWKAIGGKKDISIGKYFGCCISYGASGLGTLPKCGMILENDSLYLNIFNSAIYEFNVKGKKIKVIVSGDYPNNGNLTVDIENTCAKELKLYIRKPSWCKDYKLYVNSTLVKNNLNDGYLQLSLKKGQTSIKLDFKMPISFLSSSIYNRLIDYRVSVSKGPVVLALDNVEGDGIIPFDLKQTTAKTRLINGKLQYELLTVSGKKVYLNKYSDSAKEIPNKTCTSVWHRIK